MNRTVVWITEALYSNETLKLVTDNSTLAKSLQHTADVVNAENCTILTDDSVNITDTTDATNAQLLKYVVKQNETLSPEDKKGGHYKNALKRKRRATTGIFDPHPALATLPLRIIADDDFYSIPGDIVATTHKPVIKENLKATAPQVFPQFTLVPVLPPGYLERYNVSTEVKHPVVNKKPEFDTSKSLKSSSKSKVTLENVSKDYNTKFDDENEPNHPKPKSDNFKPDGFSNNNKYNSELDDFDDYERPYNSHPNKKTNNHKQKKQYVNNENDHDDDDISRVQDKTSDHFETLSENTKPKHSQNSYSNPYHSSRSHSYEFVPKSIMKSSEDSKNVPYKEEHSDDENRDTYKTNKHGKANHISRDNLSKTERNYNNDNEQENEFIPESSEEENENAHFKDNKKVVPHTYDEKKHRNEDNFRPTGYTPTSKNKLTEPLFKPNGYTDSDAPQKTNREEDTVEDYDDQPGLHKSQLEVKNIDEPEAHQKSETYEEDNSREYRKYPKSPEVNNRNVYQDDKTTNIPLDINIRKDVNENTERKLNSKKVADDALAENEKPDIAKSRKTHNEDNSSDENEDGEEPSLHYTRRKPNYEHANNGYSKPVPQASSEENYDETEDKNESDIVRENSEPQEEYPKYRSSHTSENKKSYPPPSNIERHSKDIEENFNEDDSKENKSHNHYYSPRNSNERLEKTDNRDAEYPKYRSSHTSENTESYPPKLNIERRSKDAEENFNEDDSKENQSHNDYYSPRNSNERLEKTDNRDDSGEHDQEKPLHEPYNLKENVNERFKQNSREGSDENVSSEESDTKLNKQFNVHPIEASVENKRHSSDTGSEEQNNEDEEKEKPKLLYENFQSHDYPTRKPAAFSKGNEDNSDRNSKSSYRLDNLKKNSGSDSKNGPDDFSEENNNDNKKAKISYETYHPSIDEYPKRIPTGFTKESQDNVNISYETFHPLISEFPKPKSSEKYIDEINVKPKLSYETYHSPVNAAEYRKPDPTETTHENLDKNGKAQISYETYHPQGNMYDNSQEILAEPELKFNQALITPVNPKVSYETYHPLVRSNEYTQPEGTSKENVEENARDIQPKQYFEIFTQAKTPTVSPNDQGNNQHDKTSYSSKEIQGKLPKKYKPKPIFYDYNTFNPYKNLYPGAVAKVPKLPMFYSKKHSELPELGIKGNVKQQFERIPLNYMHDSHNPRKPKVQGNKLGYVNGYVNAQYTPKENENFSSKEDKEDVEGNGPSNKYKTDLDIKLDDLKLDLPEIKLPESVLLYDSEEKEQNESSEDKTEKYQVKEKDSEEDEDAEVPEEDEDAEEPEEEKDEEENHYGLPPPKQDTNDSPKSADNKQSEDDLYGKFFNDNIDLYESFVQDHFNKKGTFAERSQDVIEDPVLKSTMQDVLRRVAKSTKEAEKSENPKYGYKWTLNYGKPL